LLSTPLAAQEEQPKQATQATQATQEKAKKNHFFQGVSLSTDLFGVVGRVFGNDFDSYEVSAEFNLKNKYFPVVEVGYGSTDETDDDNNIHYKVAAPYFRVGVNYNFMHKKQSPNYVYGGLRFGYSSFSYDVDAPALVDPVWGGSVPFEYNDVSSNASWAELVVGLRAQIVKNFHMGWSLRYKRRISVKDSPNTEAWYIPGFGINDSAVFGATYNLIYYLPW
jgi:hypothetical protein